MMMPVVIARAASFLIPFLFVAALAQDEPRNIGSINFYGYAGLNLHQVESALPIHAGDRYPGPFETVQGINKAVRLVLGRPPADVASVCCDAQGNYMIYVGLPGASITHTKFNPVPKGKTQLPPEIVQLYEQTMEASTVAVLKGDAREDTSKGYALSASDEALRAKQMEVRAYAVRHDQLIRAVLDTSGAALQRIVAAYLLGYARQSRGQIASLVQASQDADETVRNNATRALGVLAESSPKVAARIPADGFIRMLSSGSWTDRNKAGWVLSSLTTSREPKLLERLRSQALVSLIEMARWRTGHAQTPRMLLARIAGIEEERARQLAAADNADEIIKALAP